MHDYTATFDINKEGLISRTFLRKSTNNLQYILCNTRQAKYILKVVKAPANPNEALMTGPDFFLLSSKKLSGQMERERESCLSILRSRAAFQI